MVSEDESSKKKKKRRKRAKKKKKQQFDAEDDDGSEEFEKVEEKSGPVIRGQFATYGRGKVGKDDFKEDSVDEKPKKKKKRKKKKKKNREEEEEYLDDYEPAKNNFLKEPEVSKDTEVKLSMRERMALKKKQGNSV